MVALPEKREPLRMTEAEYLEFEQNNDVKHEFIDGEVYAMSGASRAHNLINVNLIRILSTQLRSQACDVYPSDMRVKISSGKYTYPDLSILCGEAIFTNDGGTENLTNPSVIIEILSPSTEAYDRGKKFQSYRKLSSLQEYILVAQDSPRIERYQRQEGGIWRFTEAEGLAQSIELTAVGCTLPLDEVYERVELGG